MPQQNTRPQFIHHPGIDCKPLIFSLLLCLGLTACSNEQAASSEVVVSLSPRLEQLFLQSCANCHIKAKTGAPLAGDRQTWQEILEKGLNVTLENTINGYGGMPPGGQCFECTAEDLSQLILFMAQVSPDNTSTAKSEDTP